MTKTEQSLVRVETLLKDYLSQGVKGAGGVLSAVRIALDLVSREDVIARGRYVADILLPLTSPAPYQAISNETGALLYRTLVDAFCETSSLADAARWAPLIAKGRVHDGNENETFGPLKNRYLPCEKVWLVLAAASGKSAHDLCISQAGAAAYHGAIRNIAFIRTLIHRMSY